MQHGSWDYSKLVGPFATVKSALSWMARRAKTRGEHELKWFNELDDWSEYEDLVNSGDYHGVIIQGLSPTDPAATRYELFEVENPSRV